LDKFPLIKFVIFFICGILLQFYFRIENLVLLYLFLSIVSASAISIFYLKTDPTKNILLVSSIIIGGAIFYSSTGTENAAYPFKEPKIKNAIVSGRIYSIDLAKKDRVNFYIDTDSIYYEKRKLKACLKILVKVSDAKSKLVSLYQKISIGNSIQIAATILKPRDQRNPGEFDYEKYLSAQGVSALCNVYKTSDVNITNSQKSIIANAIFGLRKSIDKIISKIHNQSTASLLRGLILADKSMIENQLRNEFVNAGVIHVLAVSGLHVGFVILIFVFLFRRFNIILDIFSLF
jgi:competence protein ComEC